MKKSYSRNREWGIGNRQREIKIQVKVKPNSKQQKIEEDPDGVFTVRLKSPPVDGKANKKLISISDPKISSL